MKSIISILCLTFITNILFAQVDIPIGTWRIHTPGRICKTIEKVGNKIYAGSESSFIVYNQDDNTVKSLSKIDGFNGSGVSVLRYHKSTSTLLIGYIDGNLDLLNDDGTITNLNDIKRASIIGSKQINHISFKGNLAYLSCKFGIVVVDLAKAEVKETYSNIGLNGAQVEVFSSALKGDSIYVVTSQGLKVGSTLLNYNLIDFNNWYSFDNDTNIPTGTLFKGIGVINNTVFVSSSKSEIYKSVGNSWLVDSSFVFPSQTNVSIRNSGNQLQFIHPSKIISINEGFNKIEFNNIDNIGDVVLENSNLIWLSNSEKGIVKFENSNQTSISPNSPYFKSSFKFKSYKDWDGTENMLVTTGGYDASGNPKYLPYGIYIFKNGIWENFNDKMGNLPSSSTYIDADYNEVDSSIYVACFNGLFKIKRTGFQSATSTILNRDNTDYGLVDLWGGAGGYFLFDVKFDSHNMGWVVGPQRSSTNSPSIFSFKDNVWTNYTISTIGSVAKYPVEILIDDTDSKWIRYPINQGGGILVFNEKSNPKYKYLTDQVGEGKLPSMGVNCFAKEKGGSLWIGTDKGIALFNNPNSVLTSNSYDATTPVYENRALLHDKSIKCITIDGANRKWIGTIDGVWLFNEDGSQQIANFTTSNSPLPSNNIYDIEISKTTGEVFFATDAGMISYRGTATDPLTVNSTEEGTFTAKVFPNPVTPEFSGQIAITGLPISTNVKITDINGVLVYETQSNGGTATWNGHTYSGSKVNSGIYLVFATNKEGMQTMVTKFAVVK